MAVSRSQLDTDLIFAHETQDKARLIALYTQAADLLAATDDLQGQAFYLTHAWVYAVETGAKAEQWLYERLKSLKAVD